jgi:UDP-N-acetylglucosamine--N-acetylmuramyl-(pentapeptide) pyrophosphoryl-undecaprenol N-acetylglucosamine transferase
MAIFSAINSLTEKYSIIHQTGSSSLFNDFSHAQSLATKDYEVFDFDSQKAILALQTCDVVVGRSGAHTIYELGLLGKRSVLIPIPWVSHNEQMENAKMLEAAGIAIILPESKLTEENLLASIDRSLSLDPRPLELPRDATLRLVELVEQQWGRS